MNDNSSWSCLYWAPFTQPRRLFASDEVLVCADDEQRAIIQVPSEKDGVPIRGKSFILVEYPADIAAIESLAVCGRLIYFVSANVQLL